MKDEEMAKEYAEGYRKDLKSKFFLSEPQLDLACQGYKEGFLAGLKAGRPQWHTPDARLPEEEGDYLFCLRDGEETMYDIVGVSIDGNGYVSLDSHIWSITDVIAWTELPTFDKE